MQLDTKWSMERWQEEAQLELVRQDPNEFIEYVLTDETGQKLKQGEIHYLWQYHIRFAWDNGFMPVILGLWEHGKTFQVLAPVVHELNKNRNLRIAYISDTDRTASKRATFLGNLIKTNKKFRKAFPNIEPETKLRKWVNVNWTVKRDEDVSIIDSTMDATGVLSAKIGQRYDITIVDDIINMRNAILQPSDRERVRGTIEALLGRLSRHGKGVWLGTSFHKEDANEMAKQKKGLLVLEHALNDEFTRYDSQIHNLPPKLKDKYFEGWHKEVEERGLSRVSRSVRDEKGVYHFRMPMWDEITPEFLRRRKELIGDVRFGWGYQQRIFDESKMIFKNFRNCLTKIDEHKTFSQENEEAMQLARIEYLKTNIHPRFPDRASSYVDNKNSLIVGSVDLSGKKRKGKIICIVAIDLVTHHKTLLTMIRLAENAIDMARQITKYHAIYGVDMWFVEDNSSQEFFMDIIDLYNQRATTDNRRQLPVMPFTTGTNKVDPSAGVISLEIEFKNGMWTIPIWGQHNEECKCSYCIMEKEFTLYPQEKTDDTVMAMWIAREGARWYMAVGENKNDQTILGLDKKYEDRFGLQEEVSELTSGMSSMLKELY